MPAPSARARRLLAKSIAAVGAAIVLGTTATAGSAAHGADTAGLPIVPDGMVRIGSPNRTGPGGTVRRVDRIVMHPGRKQDGPTRTHTRPCPPRRPLRPQRPRLPARPERT
ncbi:MULTISPECIES: hypothetical protein [unclassified Embleya]|uniref:hypothetical protein n=1 Tax=unclassified Embleya TaxID=2699296 RepID=UPI0036BDFA01